MSVSTFFFDNISKRMAEQYRDDLDELAAPTEAEGEGAQRKVVSMLKSLVKEGEIKLNQIVDESADEEAA